MISRHSRTVSWFVLVAFLSGCAAYPDHRIPKIEALPAYDGSKPRAKVILEYETRLNGDLHTEFRESGEKEKQERLIEVLRESGYFEEVGVDTDSPDLEIVVGCAFDLKLSRPSMYLTVLSAWLFPTRTLDEMTLDVHVRSVASGEIREIQVQDSIHQWFQLFLLPISFFHLYPGVEDEMLDNMYRTLALELQKSGML